MYGVLCRSKSFSFSSQAQSPHPIFLTHRPVPKGGSGEGGVIRMGLGSWERRCWVPGAERERERADAILSYEF